MEEDETGEEAAVAVRERSREEAGEEVAEESAASITTRKE